MSKENDFYPDPHGKLETKAMLKPTRGARNLIWFSLLVQSTISGFILLFACGSLLIGQLHPKDKKPLESGVYYNLITFIVGFWFPSPIHALLVEQGGHAKSDEEQPFDDRFL